MGVFFGPGKRKGFSSFKVVDRSNKTRKSTVQLPSTLPLEKEQQKLGILAIHIAEVLC